MQTRPLSKTKNGRLVRVVRRSHGEVLHADVDVAASVVGTRPAAPAPEANS